MIDDKFIDKFIESAELLAPGKNTYIFTFVPPIKHVKSTKGMVVQRGTKELEAIIRKITVNDRLYIHWYDKFLTDVIAIIPKTVPVYLFFWGGDLVEQTPAFFKFNYDSITAKYIRKQDKIETRKRISAHHNKYHRFKNYLLQKYHKNKWIKMDEDARKLFFERLNYFCHWNPLDLEVVVGAYGGNPTFLDFFYDAGLEKVSLPDYTKRQQGMARIWLGNSDTLTNNHLDAIEVLGKFRNEELSIFCPLNYGQGDYRLKVTNTGLRTFGNKWTSLLDFMPLEQYLELLNNADVVVMYHNRTQGAGNVFAFIKMGKKVFVKRQSTVFGFLQKHGIVVFDANTIKDLSFEEFVRPLTVEEQRNNCDKISTLFSDIRRQELLTAILN